MIDLHTHSTCSDGSLTPTQLVDAAAAAGVSTLALTDHDSTDGIAEFMAACAKREIEGVPGVEMSADYSPGTLHMLGYFLDTGNPALQEVLGQIREGREDRNALILKKLTALGMKLDWEKVAAKAGSDVVGRPHFAQAMVDAGIVATFKDAFDLYLGKGKPAYVDRYRLSPEAAIQLIRGAGGVAVLSHPFTLQLGQQELRQQVGRLRDQGLQGIEVYYSEHNREQTHEYETLARDYGLLMTGGTDFHGTINPDIKLGRGFGPLEVPDRLMDGIRRAAGNRK